MKAAKRKPFLKKRIYNYIIRLVKFLTGLPRDFNFRMDKIIFLIGPTATGKTQTAYSLARHLKAEVVSCDSMLVYREPEIITSKPSTKILEDVPHHFVNMISVCESYNVFDYYLAAVEKINSLNACGTPVIVCGGSGLYVKAILDGIFEGVGQDEELRKILEERAEKNGTREVYDELSKVDPDTAAKISQADLKRIIRALEVYYRSGVPLSKKKKEARGIYGKLPVKLFGLTVNRPALYDRINLRVDEMIDHGAIDEVKKLLGFKLSRTAQKIIGINEISAYLNGKCSLDEAKENMKRNTRRFAKRQVTWFKADKRIEWIGADNLTPEQAKDEVMDRINSMKKSHSLRSGGETILSQG